MYALCCSYLCCHSYLCCCNCHFQVVQPWTHDPISWLKSVCTIRWGLGVTTVNGAHLNRTQPPPIEHDWTPDWAWTQLLRLTEISLKTWDTVQRWFTAAQTLTMTPGTRRRDRWGYDRHESTEQREGESSISIRQNGFLSCNMFTSYSMNWGFYF